MSDDHNNDDDKWKNIIKEWEKKIEGLKKLAEQGNAEAQLYLGDAYYYGR